MVQKRFLQLSPERKGLIRRCQDIGFGKIMHFSISNGEPLFTPETELFLDVKLDSDAQPRTEIDLSDFTLSSEIIRLFERFEAIGNGVVDHLEIRAGLPR